MRRAADATAPTTAFDAGEKMDDPVKMYLTDVFTVPTSLAGVPGISIPFAPNKHGLPVGLQLTATPATTSVAARRRRPRAAGRVQPTSGGLLNPITVTPSAARGR